MDPGILSGAVDGGLHNRFERGSTHVLAVTRVHIYVRTIGRTTSSNARGPKSNTITGSVPVSLLLCLRFAMTPQINKLRFVLKCVSSV